MSDERQRFSPNRIVATTIDELILSLNDYFRRIRAALEVPGGEFFEFEKNHVAPSKVRDGLTVYADGTDWDPGSGEGLYMYYNSTWNKLG